MKDIQRLRAEGKSEKEISEALSLKYETQNNSLRVSSEPLSIEYSNLLSEMDSSVAIIKDENMSEVEFNKAFVEAVKKVNTKAQFSSTLTLEEKYAFEYVYSETQNIYLIAKELTLIEGASVARVEGLFKSKKQKCKAQALLNSAGTGALAGGLIGAAAGGGIGSIPAAAVGAVIGGTIGLFTFGSATAAKC